MQEKDQQKPSLKEPFPIPHAREEERDGFLEVGYRPLLGEDGIFPQWEKYTQWRPALRRKVKETGWFDHHPPDELPAYSCCMSSESNYLIHPEFVESAKKIRKRLSPPKIKEKRAINQGMKKERINPEEVTEAVFQSLKDSKEQGKIQKEYPKEAVSAVLIDEEMPGEGSQALRSFLKEHGFSVGQEVNSQYPLTSVEDDDLPLFYLKEVGQYPLLSCEEEILGNALVRFSHDSKKVEAAKQRFLEGNQRLIVSIAKKYRGYGVPFLDLIQEGNFGLMHAIEKFDFRRGTRFSTYATWWIRQAVVRSLPSQGRTISLPIKVGNQIRKLIKTTQRLEQELAGRKPTEKELAQALDINPKRLRIISQAPTRTISLETPVGEDEDSGLGDFISDKSFPSPEEVVADDLLAEKLEKVLETLDPREEKILRLRFGLNDSRESYTLKEVGEMFGLTRERIRQIQNDALRRLRHPSHARLLKDFMYEER